MSNKEFVLQALGATALIFVLATILVTGFLMCGNEPSWGEFQ